MKWTNIVAFFAATFGIGKSVVKVDEATQSPTFTAEQADKLDEALGNLEQLKTDNTELTGKLETAQKDLDTANETITARDQRIAELEAELKAPGRSGAEANDDPEPETGNTFGPGHPLYTSADAEAAENAKLWGKK
ncbi:MAG: hypothetical protein H7A09_10695 [Oceanospirillaceae bacterium]|nr:hypothetical protein [Chitinophagales bacterium]MCP5326776.1 hypothetical protein [Oceanospirillaceae bacterium]